MTKYSNYRLYKCILIFAFSITVYNIAYSRSSPVNYTVKINNDISAQFKDNGGEITINKKTYQMPFINYWLSPNDDYLRVYLRDEKDIYVILGWKADPFWSNQVGVVICVLPYPYEGKNWIFLLDSHHSSLKNSLVFTEYTTPYFETDQLTIKYGVNDSLIPNRNHLIKCYEDPNDHYKLWTQKDMY